MSSRRTDQVRSIARIFSVAAIGVLIAAGMVGWSGSAWPDIAVGGVIAPIFLRSAWRVLAEAIPAWREAQPVPTAVLR